MKSRSGVLGGLLGLVLLVGLLVAANRMGLVSGAADDPAPAPSASARASATPTARATLTVDPESGLATVPLGSLPTQAQQTVALIDRGGPFPFAKDGAVFGNRERILPAKPSGFYREYTVVTPGENDRGARRIVTGDRDRQLFYTDDHYASFRRVAR